MTASLAVLLAGLGNPSPARADWLLTPWAGLKLTGSTTFVDPEDGAGTVKFSVGGSVGFLSDGLFGFEVDAAYMPSFFEGDSAGLATGSRVASVMGNLVIAVPRAVTRESLRPYVVGGLGLLQTRIDTAADVFSIESRLLGMTAGGGVLGPISDRASLRLDLRYLRNVTEGKGPAVGFGPTRLTFWRVSAGVAILF